MKIIKYAASNNRKSVIFLLFTARLARYAGEHTQSNLGNIKFD